MNENYRSFFGLKKEPFGADIAMKDILETDKIADVKTRLDYVIRLGAVALSPEMWAAVNQRPSDLAKGICIHPSSVASILRPHRAPLWSFTDNC